MCAATNGMGIVPRKTSNWRLEAEVPGASIVDVVLPPQHALDEDLTEERASGGRELGSGMECKIVGSLR